jgi:hypothetical protein
MGEAAVAALRERLGVEAGGAGELGALAGRPLGRLARGRVDLLHDLPHEGQLGGHRVAIGEREGRFPHRHDKRWCPGEELATSTIACLALSEPS